MDFGSIEFERSSCPFESWGEVHIPGDDPSIEKRKHAVLDVFLRDCWRLAEGVVAEVLRQDALRLAYFLVISLPNAKLLKLYVADPTLAAPIFELIGRDEAEFLSDHAVADCVLGVGSEERVLLFLHLLANRLVDELEGYWLRNRLLQFWKELLL